MNTCYNKENCYRTFTDDNKNWISAKNDKLFQNYLKLQ